MELYCDNKTMMGIAHNHIQHDKTKHVEVDRHFIKEKPNAKLISFSFVFSKDELANVLTMVILSMAFYDSLNKLSIRDLYAST